MTRRLLALLLSLGCALDAWAWGSDGHSVIAEIASRRLAPDTRAEVERLLGPGVSLASIANWADDVRPERTATTNWHFINIPVGEDRYDPALRCKPSPTGDCIVAALERQRAILSCSRDAVERREALMFAAHFVGDLHQPFHTIDEARGGNDVKLEVEIRAGKCPRCEARRTPSNLHQVWDSTLISQTVWNWGAYVTKLERGFLAGEEARLAAAGTVTDWMLDSHRVAARAWPLTPVDNLIGDDYYAKALPLVERQLALAGVRLAKFLDETLGKPPTPARCGG